MQMDFPGSLCCHLLASGQACSPRRLICILGAGQNADGLSHSAVLSFAGFRSGMQSLVAPDDPSAFWELAKMQMDFPGALCCHLLASGQACSLWWPQTTHLHFGSWPKCRWTFSQRCAVICWLQVGHAVSGGPRRPICILGAGQNADGLSQVAVLSLAGFRSGMHVSGGPRRPHLHFGS